MMAIPFNKGYLSMWCPLLATLVLWGCRNPKLKDKDFIGPAYITATANFKVLDDKIIFSSKTPDFSNLNTTLGISATLNEPVSWTLTIEGLLSGAVKKISETSNKVEVNWKGGSSNIYFFRKGEKAVATLSFLGTNYIVKDTVTITNTLTYNGLIDGVEHIFIDDLELGRNLGSIPQDISLIPFGATAFTTFYASPTDGECRGCSDRKYPINPVQGQYSYFMSGIDRDNNTYVGSFDQGTLADPNTPELNGLIGRINTTNNDDVYINMYIYGYAKTNPNTMISIIAWEVDSYQSKNKIGLIVPVEQKLQDSLILNPNITLTKLVGPRNNDKDYGFKYAKPPLKGNDKWIYRFKVDWEGWRLVSFKYSNFFRIAFGGSGMGNNKLECQKFSSFSVSLDCDPGGAEAKAQLDYAVVTIGAPFKQRQ